MSTYNLNTHPNWKYLKSYLKNMSCINFPTFIKETIKISKEISKEINGNNTVIYGFNIYNNRYYDKNNTFLEELFVNDIQNKVVGDILEIFCGFFLQYFETDPVFGIKRGSYKFNNDLTNDPKNTDIGCDAVGTFTTTNNSAFIQVKYRTDPKAKPFDKNVFMNLFGEGILKYNLQPENTLQRMIFFTNISVGTKENWDGKTGIFNALTELCKVPVLCIGKNEIEKLVGNKNSSNEVFWQEFKKNI